MDVNKYRALFIEEGRDHLSELSRVLVRLESAQERVPVIDEVFRHVHSIKGMAASMGYDPISNLAHRLEDAVAVYRARPDSLSRESIDALLRGVDVLGAQVEAIAQNQALPQDFALLHALAAIVQRPAQEDTPQAAAAGRRTVIVNVHIDEACSSPSVRAFLVHRKLAAAGELLGSTPAIEHIKSGQLGTLDLRFVLSTQASDAALLQTLQGIPDVHGVQVTPGADPKSVAPLPSASAAASNADARAETKRVANTVRVRTDVVDTLIDSVGELFIARERLRILLGGKLPSEVRAALDALGSRIRELHDQVMAVRMMPVRTLTDRYPRLVRDLARSLAKEVTLEVRGGDIELDRAILDNLDVPFLHILRNAIDHGIEPPPERTAKGKRAGGSIVVSAARDRDSIVIAVEDDGRGLDADALKRVAVQKGILSQGQADNLTAREAYFLICRPGFSTKQEVSDVSGRGVGMDAVQSQIEALGGTLDIESGPRAGTRITMRLPLTLAITPVLLVEARQRTFAIPVTKVVAVRELGDDVIHEAGGGMYMSYRHALTPVLNLAEVLRLGEAPNAQHVVVLEDGRDLFALAVERIGGYQEVVVKPLGDPLDRLEWFSGATVLGDGRPILILDIKHAVRARHAA